MTERNWAEIDSWVWEAYTGNAVYCIEEGKWPEYAVTFTPDVRLPVPRLHEDKEELDALCAPLKEHGWTIHAYRVNAVVGGQEWNPWWGVAREESGAPGYKPGSAYEDTRERSIVVALWAATGGE